MRRYGSPGSTPKLLPTPSTSGGRGVESKPIWSAVPRALRDRTESLLGAHVVHARRAFGGYGPSATFRLLLGNGRRAFFKGVYPLPDGSPVEWSLDREQRVFEQLADLISPWAPAYYGAVVDDGWHALLLEDVGAATVPPWTGAKARAAMRGYGEFHARSVGRRLPDWLPGRRSRVRFAQAWQRLSESAGGVARLAELAGPSSSDAASWLERHLPALDATSRALARSPGPSALLHFDTRSDNIRVHLRAPVPLRIFDWPAADAGPSELDLVAFAQSIACEGGPAPERLAGWYAEAHAVRAEVLAHSAAAVAGFFAERAWLPHVELLPRLRSIQRRQLKATLAWTARLLDLPAPRWLEAVPE